MELTAGLIATGLPAIVATFDAAVAAPLRRARVDLSSKVVVAPPPRATAVHTGSDLVKDPPASAAAPSCPAGTSSLGSA